MTPLLICPASGKPPPLICPVQMMFKLWGQRIEEAHALHRVGLLWDRNVAERVRFSLSHRQ
jgi:hypothetical protein